jgi:hypothetical protein
MSLRVTPWSWFSHSPTKVSGGKATSTVSNKAGAHGVTTVQPGMEEEGNNINSQFLLLLRSWRV